MKHAASSWLAEKRLKNFPCLAFILACRSKIHAASWIYLAPVFLCWTLLSWPAHSAAPSGIDIQIEVTTTAVRKINTEQIVVALIPKNRPKQLVMHKEIKQSNAQFRPFITVAQPASVVEFPNFDDFAHHVYSFSNALSFELPLYRGDQKQKLMPEKSGIVPIGCNIHDWMLGYIIIVDTPYYAFLKGNVAKFNNLQDGDYELAMWHPSMDDFWMQPLSISDSDSRFVIPLPVSLSPVSQPPTPDLEDMDEEDY